MMSRPCKLLKVHNIIHVRRRIHTSTTTPKTMHAANLHFGIPPNNMARNCYNNNNVVTVKSGLFELTLCTLMVRERKRAGSGVIIHVASDMYTSFIIQTRSRTRALLAFILYTRVRIFIYNIIIFEGRARLQNNYAWRRRI